MSIYQAPWTDKEVESLNQFQINNTCHPFTCGEHEVDGSEHVLKATNIGWYCPKCREKGKEYNQNWCHDWMANWLWIPDP